MLQQDITALSAGIELALHATGYHSLRGIDMTLHDEVVILRGCVPNYYMKQLAQAIALVVPGGLNVRNELTVS